MAGKRQHYLPRFLSKGFALKNDAQTVMSWVFQKDKIYKSNILNIGVEQYFYGNVNCVLDEDITSLENSFSVEIEKLRLIDSNVYHIKNGIFPKLFFLQLIRTRNARVTLEEIYNYGIDKAFSEARLSLSNGSFYENFKNNQQYKELYQFVSNGLISNDVFTNIVSTALDKLEPYLSETQKALSSQATEISTNVHKNIMGQYIDGDLYNKLYDNLMDCSWNILVFDSVHPLILGDCGCYIKNNNDEVTTWFNYQDVDKVLFPISTKHLILGSKSKIENIKLDIDEINIGSSKCSKIFFISSQNTQREYKYLQFLNKNSNVW
jgi:hypothetical protein